MQKFNPQFNDATGYPVSLKLGRHEGGGISLSVNRDRIGLPGGSCYCITRAAGVPAGSDQVALAVDTDWERAIVQNLIQNQVILPKEAGDAGPGFHLTPEIKAHILALPGFESFTFDAPAGETIDVKGLALVAQDQRLFAQMAELEAQLLQLRERLSPNAIRLTTLGMRNADIAKLIERAARQGQADTAAAAPAFAGRKPDAPHAMGSA